MCDQYVSHTSRSTRTTHNDNQHSVSEESLGGPDELSESAAALACGLAVAGAFALGGVGFRLRPFRISERRDCCGDDVVEV
jgi:hypothetical protein